MKGLATLLIAGLLTSVGALAGPLEMSFGGGPTAAALGTVNASIDVVNALITHLNETFAVHPDVAGSVDPLDPMVSGFAFRIGERIWLTDWFGVGAAAEYFASSTETRGAYDGSEVSTIDLALGAKSVSITAGGRAIFLDVGLQLAADAAIGYYYVLFDRAVQFEIPTEYPDVISAVPADGDVRYTGSVLGFEAGLSLSYPVAPWFTLGSSVTYRSTASGAVTDAAGEELDLVGDGTPDAIDLDGITVRLTFSINIDLSPDGEKE